MADCDSYLTIQWWRPNFVAEEEKIRFVAAWIRIPGGVLTQIGRHVGKVMKIDKTTIMGERGRYTRMCVHVNLEAPLLSWFRMNGRTGHLGEVSNRKWWNSHCAVGGSEERFNLFAS
ncbi:hypothetical protein V2J09_023008 [Rumex salicifolius]